MLFFVHDFRGNDWSLGKDVRELMYSDLLNAGVRRDTVLCEEAAVGVVVAVEVDHAHTHWTEQAKPLNAVGAGVAIVRGDSSEDARTGHSEAPRDKLVRVGVCMMST